MARSRSRSRGRRRSLLLLLAALILAGSALFVVRNWSGAGPASTPLIVTVAEGSTLRRAATTLEEQGAIRSAENFVQLARLLGSGDPIKAGEYEIPAQASASDILKLLQSGKTLQRFVTIPEGTPSIVVQEKLMAAELLTGPAPLPAEGSVLPDSYSYQRGEARAAVLMRMQDAMTRTLDALWRKRKPGLAISSKRDALILASIVEKETGVPAERRTVAAVYSNRLEKGMRLQADPTTIYPTTKGKPLGRRIRRSELDAVNGYNTYAKAGLPVGPIANPGRDSIAAVLDPAPSRALYFVADGKGGHIFADTLQQHNANVQRWYGIRRARGEM